MEKQPIVLIPGIKGTQLTNVNDVDFKTIWSGIKKFFSNIHELVLQKDGVTDAGEENIIERSDVENLAYSEITNYLRSIGYRVFIFGYDWRKSNAESAKELAEFVQKIQKKSKGGQNKKVNFITHSMGGLVLSAYLKQLTNESREAIINKVIFTVPPFLGSIEATYNLVIGKSKLFNTSDDFRKVGRTFPGLYELLPVYNGAYVFEDGSSYDHYDFDTYWQQVNHDGNTPLEKYEFIIHRLQALKQVRNQQDFIFDLGSLDADLRERIIVLAGGGEDTQTKISVKKDHYNYKYFFDFKEYNNEEEDSGDGTVPLVSSTAFKDTIDTFKVNTTWIQKRIDSNYILADRHAFFLNNGRVQNIVKRFFDPGFELTEDWYQSAGKEIEKL